ncbi:MAG TPA: ABC transporter permease [Saprospiraceae bacterium]|nr:ABC transporter permease [Saprospiraceae bacterium]HND86817.1 ABC transporter permease [Saprospiraceae bacterium]HNG89131.1 ABC transporter permease [Saprospiraceae bacterium]
MPFSEILSMAFQNIRANLLRAILTLLIIAFGIMALVGILTAIDAIAYSLNDNFSGLGANSFTIEPKWGQVSSNRGGRRQKAGEEISYRQALEFKERFDFPAKVSLSLRGTSLATVKHANEETNPNVHFMGVDENFFDVKGMDIEFGRGFSQNEVDEGQDRVVLGQEIANKLFKNKPEKAIDQVVLVGANRYRVVGVLNSKGSSMGNSSDRAVYAPLVSVKSLYGTDDTNYDVVVAVNNATDMEAAESEAMGVFRQVRGLRPGEEEDFEVFTSNSLVSMLKDNTVTLRIATVAIGLMTLLGAAIGLMNIMLVSVTERTREIGIYKALGATRRSILLQFLTEAIVICQMGGLVGIFFGILIGNIVTPLLGGSFLIPWGWMFLGFTLCMAVGILSGFYPAMKAARLDPIESLRYE